MLAAKFEQKEPPPFPDPLQWHICGRNAVFMAAEGFVYLLITLLVEYIRIWRLRRSVSPKDCALEANEDEDVTKERETVANTPSAAVKLKDLTKVYKKGSKPFTAVNRLTLAIPHGQCFGLLGVNGAGIL